MLRPPICSKAKRPLKRSYCAAKWWLSSRLLAKVPAYSHKVAKTGFQVGLALGYPPASNSGDSTQTCMKPVQPTQGFADSFLLMPASARVGGASGNGSLTDLHFDAKQASTGKLF